MARRRLEGLERVLGVNALFSTAYGNVGSSIYYALGLVAALALGLTPIVFLITGIFFLCTAATYAEATAMYPEAGGSSSFARRAFNEFWSFFAAWGQMLNYVVTVAISAFFVPHYLGSVFWSELRHSPGDIVAGAIIIAILAAINVVGVKESAGLNIGLAVIDFLTQVLLVLVGAVLVLGANPGQLADNVHWGIAPTWKDFILAIPIGMIAYTGIETISNMAEEAKDEVKTIPAAIKRVAIAVFAIYFTLPAVAPGAPPVTQQADGTHPPRLGLPEQEGGHAGDPIAGGRPPLRLGLPEQEGGYAGDPIAGVVAHLNLGPLQTPATIYVGILAATILFLATNAGLIGVSRLVYSMGIHRQLPDRLRQLHPRFRTPWIGIIVFGVVAILITLPGQAEFLGYLYAFGAMLSFTIAHSAVIRLRFAHPELVRPYRPPGNLTIAGKDVPVFAFLGGFGTLAALIVTIALHPTVAITGVCWLCLGVVVYLLYRRSQGLDLTSTHKVAIAQPVVDHEAEYDSVLVPLGDRYDESVMATAAKLAARKRRGIHVLSLITVPSALKIDAPMPEAIANAESLIEQARVQAGARVSGHVERVRSGQAGRRIIEEAVDMRAAAIVMPLPERINGGSLFGKTLETVLAERPCRVIIESQPAPGGIKRRSLVA